jgi:ubiquinone/menaquinone biosynthesis C-methylase UbiE/uncharacterized protein YbaR (Trm112 family)
VKYRLIDIISCPYDGTHPLRLRADKDNIIPCPGPLREAKPPLCSLYCGLHSRTIGGDDGRFEYGCGECLGLEIRKGALDCGECGRGYPIIDGILSVMPDELSDAPGAGEPLDRGGQVEYDRAHEKRMRDKEVTHKIVRDPTLQFLKDLEIEGVKRRLQMNGGKRGTVLDVGVGNGESTLRVLGCCKEVVVSDFSFQSLAHAERLFLKNRRFNFYPVQMDACNIPFRKDSFDMAISMVTLHHLPSADLRERAIKNLSGVLHDSGEALITMYNDHLMKKINRILKSHDFESYAMKEGLHSTGIYYYNYAHGELREIIGRYFDILELNGLAPVIPKVTRFIKTHRKTGDYIIGYLEKTRLMRLFGNLLIVRGIKK